MIRYLIAGLIIGGLVVFDALVMWACCLADRDRRRDDDEQLKWIRWWNDQHNKLP